MCSSSETRLYKSDDRIITSQCNESIFTRQCNKHVITHQSNEPITTHGCKGANFRLLWGGGGGLEFF